MASCVKNLKRGRSTRRFKSHTLPCVPHMSHPILPICHTPIFFPPYGRFLFVYERHLKSSSTSPKICRRQWRAYTRAARWRPPSRASSPKRLCVSHCKPLTATYPPPPPPHLSHSPFFLISHTLPILSHLSHHPPFIHICINTGIDSSQGARPPPIHRAWPTRCRKAWPHRLRAHEARVAPFPYCAIFQPKTRRPSSPSRHILA